MAGIPPTHHDGDLCQRRGRGGAEHRRADVVTPWYLYASRPEQRVLQFRAIVGAGDTTMSTTTPPDLAEHVIATLRAHETELRGAGIRRLSLFGSVARNDANVDSDVDLAAELDPEARIGLFALGALERRLAELLGREVDLLAEPVETDRLRANIDRDRRLAF